MFQTIPRSVVKLNTLHVVLNNHGLRASFVQAFLNCDDVLSQFILASAYDKNAIEEIIYKRDLSDRISLCEKVGGELDEMAAKEHDVVLPDGNEADMLQLVKLDLLTDKVQEENNHAIQLLPLIPEKVEKRLESKRQAAANAKEKRLAEKAKKNSK